MNPLNGNGWEGNEGKQQILIMDTIYTSRNVFIITIKRENSHVSTLLKSTGPA